MARKLEYESWEQLMLEEITAFETAADDEELLLLDSESYDELIFERDERDAHRWELDPASADDWLDRGKLVADGPAQRWRHFGH